MEALLYSTPYYASPFNVSFEIIRLREIDSKKAIYIGRMEQYTLRQNIARRKYELELDCLRRDDLTIQLNRINNEMIKYPDMNLSYALAVTKNNLDMVNVVIERHKIELQEMMSTIVKETIENDEE